MMKPVKTFYGAILFFLFLGGTPLSAGIGLKARLQCFSFKEAWVDVEAAIGEGQLRLDFRGPGSRGSLIYNRETSIVTLVDDIHKTILPLTPDNQTALKWIGPIASERLRNEIAGWRGSKSRTFEVARENARAFFNGVPSLRFRGKQKMGFICDEYGTDFNGERVREVWVTSLEKAGMTEEDFGTLRSLIHLIVDMGGGELSQWGVETTPFQSSLAQTQLPVMVVLYTNGKPSSQFQILRVRPHNFSANTFDPPSGYQTLSLLDIIKR